MPEQAETFHVLLISRNRLLAETLGNTLCDRGLATSIEVCASGQEHDHLRRTMLEPQLVVVDASGFDDHGRLFASVRRLCSTLAETHVVVMSKTVEESEVTGCIAAGASGFILENESIEDLHLTIDALRRGGSRCSAGVIDIVLDKIRELSDRKLRSVPHEAGTLSLREVEILEMVELGMLNKEIANQLGLQLSTIKNHLNSVFQKLNVNSRRQAVSQAIASGILHCESRLHV